MIENDITILNKIRKFAIYHNMPVSDITLRENIFNLTPDRFESFALDVFRYQYNNNEVYRQYCDAIKTREENVNQLEKIPFLPIQFFKSKQVKCGVFEPAAVFESSGTTGTINSRHFVKELSVYERSFLNTFRLFYGNVEDLCILGLLPSYLERQHSSLVYMVNELIKRSNHPKSSFYLHDTEQLYKTLIENEAARQRTLLIGVTYALLDFAELFPINLQHTIIMETGGMKGRKRELTREEVHAQLKLQFGVNEIHSEYGMTELLSQAYATDNGIFSCPPWLRICIRAEDDPFLVLTEPAVGSIFAAGAVNIIDLANIYSCSFIASDDLGKLYNNGSFEILGRMDNSDTRGCGLMLM